jgi:hypothetical protein
MTKGRVCDTAEKSQSIDKLNLRGAIARGCSHGIHDNDGAFGRRGVGGFWNGHFHRLRDRTVRRFGDVASTSAALLEFARQPTELKVGRGADPAHERRAQLGRRLPGGRTSLWPSRTAHPTSHPRCRR